MSLSSTQKLTRSARRIVVKVGSSVLTNDSGLRTRVFTELARQIAVLTKDKRDVVLVSSGAIALGSRELGWTHSDQTIPEKQAAAAIGQIGLCEMYKRRFARYGLRVSQVLVTRFDLDDRERFINARHTLNGLLELGVVPIVNENDTVATDEIRFGDNDNLSATVVNLIGADLLIILTDVEGLYERPPRKGSSKPRIIKEVREITDEIEHAAAGSSTTFGRGGMITKVQAARTAAQSGAATVLCDGRRRDIILRIAQGEAIGTIFAPSTRMKSRKHWLAFTVQTRGHLVLNSGAVLALQDGKGSLLPSGVTEVSGNFGIGDPISCRDVENHEVARGLSSYSSSDLRRIMGRSTSEINQVLGYSNGEEAIHRDDLVWLGSKTSGNS